MKSFGIGFILLACGIACAAPINLKCEINGDGNKKSEEWISIDTDSNFMRVNGSALELSMTNDFYSSMTKPVATFRTIRRIDRNTGEIVIAEVSGSQVVWKNTGKCEKSELPAKKF